MNHYTRLTKQERCLIELGVRTRQSIRAISRSIGRPPKTVLQEIKRNGGYLGYYAEKAHYMRNISNRKGYSKIEYVSNLKRYVCDKLIAGWSPEVIAGRWKKDNPKISHISHESIYQWVYKQDNDLYLQLPRKKRKRGLKPQRLKSLIPNRTPIQTRLEAINDRSEVGHYEVDLVFQQGNKSQNILSAVERKSRMLLLKKNQSKHSDVVIGGLKSIKMASKYPMKTATFDNGTEFTNHSELGIDTYFCDPGSPWQKGSIENINGIIRRHIDYKIDANDISQEMLDSVANKINSIPRKILGFLSPIEMIENLYNKKLESVTF